MSTYPRGKISKDDEGELQIAITVHSNRLIISFGKPITWLGLSKVEVEELVKLIGRRAEELKDDGLTDSDSE